MKTIEKKREYFYSNHFYNKNKNMKNNSPNLSHQENNYYYNTKINHLIFHDYTCNNPNNYKRDKSNPRFNSVDLYYNPIESNFINGNNILPRYSKNSNFNNSINLKKSDKFKNIKFSLDNTEINMNITTSRNKDIRNSTNNLKERNITKNDNINYNNIFQTKNIPLKMLDKDKKIKNININDIDANDNSLKYNINKKINENNNNNYFDLISYKNINNNYFYNIQSNVEKNNNKEIKKDFKDKNNILLNNLENINSTKHNSNYLKKISLKNHKAGNHNIKSPVPTIIKKYYKTNNNNNKMNNTHILSKNQKIKYKINNNKNISSNKFTNIIDKNKKSYNNHEINNYNNNNKLINLNINNKINSNENKYFKRNIINNINIYNSIPKKVGTNKINERNKKNKKQQDNININDINQSNINNNESLNKINKNNKNKINYYYNQLHLTYNKDPLNIKLRKFCEILEQYLYISFKNNYHNFIQKMISYIEYLNSKRALIIKRYESIKKAEKSNNNSLNNDIPSNFINEKAIQNKEVHQLKKSNSPSKFLELKENITSSMKKINQDNYIKIFNDLYKKQNSDKKSRSPFVQKKLNDSFIISNDEENKYNKYKTNTNIDIPYLPKSKSYLLKNKKVKENIAINTSNFKRYHYKYKNTNKHIGNIFDDDESLNPIKANYSIDVNLKRENSDKKLLDSSDKKNFNKNILLYSKPILTKSMSNGGDVSKKKNLNIISLRKNEKNILKNYLSINNIISPIKNIPKNKNLSRSQDKKSKKGEELIVKNIHTKDNKLSIFIKYIKVKNYLTNKSFKNKLFYSQIDSISLINNKNNKVKNINQEKKIRIKIFNDALNISADEDFKKDINSNNLKMDKAYENKIIYLFNFLENLFNDNKKTILYIFWKNLKKIKNNYILQNSIHSNEKISTVKSNNNKIADNKNIIELTKLNPSIRKTRNKDEKNNSIFNIMKSGGILEDKNNKKSNVNNILFNKSFNNIYDKNEIKMENKTDIENKEKLKKIKLEKLGKLFKNLEEENNIINTIKEQFLDWTNKNVMNLNQEKDINKKEYNLRTFDINNNNKFAKNEKRNNFEDK